ncbi:hypothetical protein [Geodermatophilus sp. SYSU D01176]
MGAPSAVLFAAATTRSGAVVSDRLYAADVGLRRLHVAVFAPSPTR